MIQSRNVKSPCKSSYNLLPGPKPVKSIAMQAVSNAYSNIATALSPLIRRGHFLSGRIVYWNDLFYLPPAPLRSVLPASVVKVSTCSLV